MSTLLDRRPTVLRGGEADLIAPVMRVPELLVPTRPDGDGNDAVGTFLEVPCEYGVIDVVHVHFAGRELTRRADGALVAVPERRLLMTLRILEREGGVADVSRLAVLGKISAGRLTKVVGPLLEARGWVRIAGSTWSLRSAVVSPVVSVVAVEIKQRDAGRGLGQAGRYAAAAEYVALALGPEGRAEQAVTRAAGAGIGLIQVLDDGAVTSWQAPRPQPNYDPLARACLAEQLLHMHASGARSGPVREVFGRMLTSSGADPRFAGE